VSLCPHPAAEELPAGRFKCREFAAGTRPLTPSTSQMKHITSSNFLHCSTPLLQLKRTKHLMTTRTVTSTLCECMIEHHSYRLLQVHHGHHSHPLISCTTANASLLLLWARGLCTSSWALPNSSCHHITRKPSTRVQTSAHNLSPMAESPVIGCSQLSSRSLVMPPFSCKTRHLRTQHTSSPRAAALSTSSVCGELHAKTMSS
jgi:hypothetical protein